MSKMPRVRPDSRIHPMKDRSSTNSVHLKPAVWALLMLMASMMPMSGFSHRLYTAKRYRYWAMRPGI